MIACKERRKLTVGKGHVLRVHHSNGMSGLSDDPGQWKGFSDSWIFGSTNNINCKTRMEQKYSCELNFAV